MITLNKSLKHKLQTPYVKTVNYGNIITVK